MGLLNPAPRIDTSSALWRHAVHETAHKIAAEHFGWRITALSIDAHGGWCDADPPWLRDRARTAGEDAVIALCGPAADHRLGWTVRRISGDDHDAARAALRRTDLTADQATEHARRLVARHWPRITRQARDLYRKATR